MTRSGCVAPTSASADRASAAITPLTLTRPIWRGLSGGFGMWAGGQSNHPGGTIYRVDGGPRLTYQVRRNVRLHADYRQRIAGDALPRSRPALTIAGDF